MTTQRDRRTKAELAAEIDHLQNQISQISQEMGKKMEEARVTMTVRLPVSLRDSIRAAAIRDEVSIQSIFEEALHSWVDTRDKARPQ